MAEYVSVGDSDEVPEGEAKAFDVSGAEIAVARVEGQLYAFSDICTHRHCNLANGGEIDGTTIECECHGSQFDMKTGEVINPPATEALETYEVREVDGIDPGRCLRRATPLARSSSSARAWPAAPPRECCVIRATRAASA